MSDYASVHLKIFNTQVFHRKKNVSTFSLGYWNVLMHLWFLLLVWILI